MEQTPIKKAKGPLAKETIKSPPTKNPVKAAPTTKSQADMKAKTSTAKKTTLATKKTTKKKQHVFTVLTFYVVILYKQ